MEKQDGLHRATEHKYAVSEKGAREGITAEAWKEEKDMLGHAGRNSAAQTTGNTIPGRARCSWRRQQGLFLMLCQVLTLF